MPDEALQPGGAFGGRGGEEPSASMVEQYPLLLILLSQLLLILPLLFHPDRRSRMTTILARRAGTLGLAICLAMAVPSGANAQAPRVEPYAVLMRDLDRYAGRGMMIGAGTGLAYGLVAERGQDRSLAIVADVLVGAVAGMAVGAVVWLVKRPGRGVAAPAPPALRR